MKINRDVANHSVYSWHREEILGQWQLAIETLVVGVVK